jgi:RHS repeat-associated protein
VAHALPCGSTWAQTFTFDVFGNLTKSGSSSWMPGYNSASNHYTLSGTTYDNDGRLTADPVHTYQWDAEGHMTANGTSTFLYDALGNMAQASWGDQYLYDASGKLLAGSNAQAAAYVAPIALPGGAAAVYSSGSLSQYQHSDWLGSVRLSSLPTPAAPNYDIAFAPYGEAYASTNVGNIFAGMTQVVAADEYETLFREYNTTQGRWITPDPAGMAAADPSNPQTWNRYAYVMNMPTTGVDPLGLYCPVPVSADGHGLGCSYNTSGPCFMCGGTGGGGGGFGGEPGPGGPSGGPSGPTFGAPVSGGGGGFGGLGCGSDFLPCGPPGVSGLTLPCDFGVCNPIGSDFVSGITGLGTPDSPFTIDVLVLAPFLQSLFGSSGGGPIKPFTLQFPNVPPGNACSKYPPGMYRSVCNNIRNSPTNNCVRGYLLGRYDPNGGYQGGAQAAHCESFAACGMSPWNPFQTIWRCNLY